MGQRQAPRPSAVLDALRVRALRGDRLADLRDGDREWIWRSILKGVRQTQVMRLAGLSLEGYAQAVARVRRAYQQRIATYKANQAVALPKVVRSVVAAPPRRRWWHFGQGG